jgi:Tol biopolymer transport system component
MISRRVLLVLLVAAIAAAPASGSFPGRNGRIFFSSTRANGVEQIFSMRDDGRGQTRLTKWGPPAELPAWAPTGKKLGS